MASKTREQRFEDLFRETYGPVRHYALRRAEPEAAQDAVAETFLVAWRRLDDVPDDGLPWLYGVARRVLANQRRSARRDAALERRVAGAQTKASPSDPGETAGDSELMRLALDRLSGRSREAVLLVAWEGLSSARAARAAGCSPRTFAVRLHRARARLAAELAALESAAAPRLEQRSLEVG